MTTEYILTTVCPDQQGIVAAISGFLADSGCNVDDAAFFSDKSSGKFFGRSVFSIEREGVTADMIGSWFGQVAHKFGMDWDIFDTSAPMKVMLLVSKFDHCLNDLLYRYRIGALPMTVTAMATSRSSCARCKLSRISASASRFFCCASLMASCRSDEAMA